MNSIVEWAVELMRADAAGILQWDPDREVLVQAISYGFVQAYNGVSLKPGEGLGGRVFQTGEPMFVQDYASWAGRSDAYVPVPPFLGTFAVPLKWNETIIGVLEMDADSRRRAFGQQDVQLATIFANLATLAIKNTQLYEGLQERSEELQRTLEREVAERTVELHHRAVQLETSARVSREITSILDIDELLGRVVELISGAFNYYSVQVFLLDCDTSHLHLRASSSDARGQLVSQGFSLPTDVRSLNAQVVQTGQVIVVNDVSEDERFRLAEPWLHTQSELVIPLQVGSRVIGTLDVQSDKKGTFRQDDVLALRSLGDQIATAIDNARLYKQSQELAVLEERTRLARELHDSVAQSLFGIDLSARAVATYLRKDVDQAEAEIKNLRCAVQDALRDMRSLIFDLRPVDSEESAGLVERLRREIEQLSSTPGPKILLEVEGSLYLPAGMEQELYRIAQEAIRNAVKHAQAKRITVSVQANPDGLQLSVQDDGRGFDTSKPGENQGHSFGLIGLRERAKRLGGHLSIDSQPGAGTLIRVQIPTCQDN